MPDAVEATGDRTLRILTLARHYVERGWCQDVSARDGRDYRSYATSPQAAAWCTVGALIRASRDLRLTVFESLDADDWFIRANDIGGNIASWNDAVERRKAHVLLAFDRAIRMRFCALNTEPTIS